MESSPSFVDWQRPEFYHITDSWRSSETMFRNFPLIRIGITSAYPSVKQAFSLSTFSHKKLPADSPWPQTPPEILSQMWLLLLFCFQACSWSTDRMSSSPCHLAAYIVMCEVLSKLPFAYLCLAHIFFLLFSRVKESAQDSLKTKQTSNQMVTCLWTQRKGQETHRHAQNEKLG